MSKPPIFIFGCLRSGTTITRAIIDSHQNICCGPETNLIQAMKSFRDEISDSWYMLKSYEVQKEDLNEKIKEIMLLFTKQYMRLKNKKRWAEKTPYNVFYVDFINELFPNCKLINVIRDGRDVVCSYKERWGRKTILHAIKEWNMAINLTRTYRTKFNKDRYIEIRYEELVSNPGRETKKLMEFLEEEWTSDLLEHHKKNHDFWFKMGDKENIDLKMERHPQRHAAGKSIFISSVGKWKRNLNVLEKVLANLLMNENLTHLGYK